MRLFRRRSGPAWPQTGDRWAHLPESPIPEHVHRELEGEVLPHGLVRSEWTERDFPAMGWHDATLWAFQVEHAAPFDQDSDAELSNRVLLDLDYITSWVDPQRGQQNFSFWVAPSTLVFSGVTELELQCNIPLNDEGPRSLADIHPVSGGWHVEGHDGFDLKVAATSFSQTIRRVPILKSSQSLDLMARGGYSYSETPASL